MELSQKRSDDDRLVRTLLAVGLAVFAFQSLRRGKRLRGLLAGLGAFALGFATQFESDSVTKGPVEEPETGSTNETGGFSCAACGEPIVVGQSRRPNEDDETVHEACLEATA
jgi:hypothetical protein